MTNLKKMAEHKNLPPHAGGEHLRVPKIEDQLCLNEEDEARTEHVAPYLTNRFLNQWYFCCMPPPVLEGMLHDGLADPNARQHDAPTFLEIISWLRVHPSFTAHGYITVGFEWRGIMIEGVEHTGAP
ncbi:MAG: hypothetical protein HY651_03840 [Acidobacteria bacterium]|nr:hypothetical protein [Acidobacteriota bacterium]